MKYTFYLKIIISCIPLLFVYSCKKTNEIKEINGIQKIAIDFSNIRNIDISDSSKIKRIPLETTDASLLYEIHSIDFVNDKISVFNRNNVIVFDEKGDFLFNVGKKGQGPGEYQSLTCSFVKDEFIYLFDNATQKVLIYDANGNFISSSRLQLQYDVSLIYPIDKTTYITKNRYKGNQNQGHTPCFSFLDDQFKLVQETNEFYLQSREFDTNCIHSFQNDILYWQFMNDTIYSIVHETIKPKYIVDFQNYAIPDHIKKTNDTEKLIEYVNQSEKTDLACGIRYIQEDSLYIRFAFVQKEAIVNYARFNKLTKNVESYHIIDSGKKMNINYFFLYKDGNIIISVNNKEDEENNPSLLFIKENDFFAD